MLITTVGLTTKKSIVSSDLFPILLQANVEKEIAMTVYSSKSQTVR